MLQFYAEVSMCVWAFVFAYSTELNFNQILGTEYSIGHKVWLTCPATAHFRTLINKKKIKLNRLS